MNNEIKLNEYVSGLGNHKLEKLGGNRWAIVRKSKSYSFSISFEKITELGFKPLNISSHNGKDEIIITTL